MQRFPLFVSAAFALIASTAHADVQITSRSSLLSTNIDFGYLGSVTTSTDSIVYATIDHTQLVRQGSATDGGPLGDVSWDAVYQYSLDQQLVPGTAQGFSGAGSIGLFTFVGGDGVSYLSSSNRLEVEFENTAPADFFLSFIATPDSRIDLVRMISPGNWDSVYSNGGYGETTMTLPLDAGAYRLMAQTDVNTYNGFSNGGSWSFEIAAVPEPSSVALLAISAAGLLVRRRKA